MATTYLTPGVYVEEIDSGPKPLTPAGTAVAAFVGFTAKAPTDDPTDPEGLKPRLVTNWTQFEQLYGGFAKGIMLPHSVYGYFNNGGSVCYVVRIPNTGPAAEPLALTAGSTGDEALSITAKTAEEGIEVVIEPSGEAPKGKGKAAADSGDDAPDGAVKPETFTIKVMKGGKEAETFTDLTLARGMRNVATVVNRASTLIEVTLATTDASLVPAAGSFPVGPAAAPIQVSGADFDGNESARKGIRGLVIADEVTMLLVPDLVTAARKEDGSLDLEMWKSVQTSMINHCEGQANRMAILDAPPGMSPQQIKEWRTDDAMYDSRFAALYYPWIKVANPVGTNGDRTMLVPPSGHMAGVWARTDDTRGVWKAPANEIIRGALDVEMKVSKEEQGLLNPIGINCIRPFGTRGIRIWGARTLSSDPSWTYINVRRLFNMVESTIMDGTQWVVFEPNDDNLWHRVRRTLTGFLNGLWAQGALFGATPDQAFFVKCDAELNTQESIDQGRLIVEVGISPVKPAEFVIFRISQWQGGSGAAE